MDGKGARRQRRQKKEASKKSDKSKNKKNVVEPYHDDTLDYLRAWNERHDLADELTKLDRRGRTKKARELMNELSERYTITYDVANRSYILREKDPKPVPKGLEDMEKL